MAEYRFSPAAQRDLGEVFDYSVATWGLAQPMDYAELIAAENQPISMRQNSKAGKMPALPKS